MRTEVLLVEQTFGDTDKDGGVRSEVHAWGHLFSQKYFKRTLIGIMMMFFQRQCFLDQNFRDGTYHSSSMERNQCFPVLRTYPDALPRSTRRHNFAPGIRRRWRCSIPGCASCHFIHRSSGCVMSRISCHRSIPSVFVALGRKPLLRCKSQWQLSSCGSLRTLTQGAAPSCASLTCQSHLWLIPSPVGIVITADRRTFYPGDAILRPLAHGGGLDRR